MTLQEKILNCKEDEIDNIISTALKEVNENAEKKESIGFKRSLSFKLTKPHKGFIHKDTKIQPHAFAEPYEVKANDYFYEFARYIKNHNTDNEYHLYCCILHFSYKYFFNNRTLDDQKKSREYFKYYEIKDLGDFKKNNKAACIEIAVLAQNLLALFGFETYLCFGYLETDKEDDLLPTPHAYNIIKSEDNYILIDYMNPAYVYENNKITNYWPFEGYLKEDELPNFLNGDIEKEFQEYMITYENMEFKFQNKDSKRKYICYKKPIKKEDGPRYTKKYKLNK